MVRDSLQQPSPLRQVPTITSDSTYTAQVLVGRLVSIYVTEDVVAVFGSCVACSEPIEEHQAVVLDWQAGVLLHKQANGGCTSRYIENYMHDNPTTTILEILVMFGISRRTAFRRLKGMRRNGTK